MSNFDFLLGVDLDEMQGLLDECAPWLMVYCVGKNGPLIVSTSNQYIAEVRKDYIHEFH